LLRFHRIAVLKGLKMQNLFRDLRLAFRTLCKTPGFTAIALAMLCTGIAINTAGFTVVNTLLHKPLPFPDPQQLVVLLEYDTVKHEQTAVSHDAYVEWRREAGSFQSMGAVRPRDFSLGGEPMRGAEASSGLLGTLGLKPILGRFPLAEEEQSAANVAVISEGLWRDRFASDPGIVGRKLALDGGSYEIVGVLPRINRYYYAGYQVWVPLHVSPKERAERFLQIVGRLRPDVSLGQAQAEMDVIAKRRATEGNQGSATAIQVRSMADGMLHVLPGYLILLAILGLVLLVICANLAGLQLARAAKRQKEVAIRVALGATRGRVLRHLMGEGFLLSLSGGAASLMFLVWLKRLLIAAVPQLAEIDFDWNVILFNLLISALTGVAFGLAPALAVSKMAVSDVLKGISAGTLMSQKRIRGVLAVGEIAVAVILLAGVGVLIRSFVSLHHVNTGFETRNLLTFHLTIPDSRYPAAEQKVRFLRESLVQVSQIPGARAVAAASQLPLSGSISKLRVREPGSGEFQLVTGRRSVVTPSYLTTLGTPLLEGRDFTEMDGPNQSRVAIVNQKMASLLWPGASAVNRHLEVEGQSVLTVVGIIQDVNQDLMKQAFPEILVPDRQEPMPHMSFLVRTSDDPEALITEVRRRIAAIDATVAVSGTQSVEEIIEGYFPRVLIFGIAGFAAVTLLLASIGLYGVISHLVGLRIQEIGIRLALGATKADIARLVMRSGFRLTVFGTAIGLGLSLVVGYLLSLALFGVRSFDPLVLGGVAVVVAIVSTLALSAPALRASRLSPIQVLRNN